MGKFSSRDRVPVRIEGDPNTVWIKAALSHGMRTRIQAAGARVHGVVGNDDAEYDFDVQAANSAVFAEFIVDWEGPDFDGVPCTLENILDVDADDPLMQKVVEEINARSKSTGATSPNSRTNGHAPTTKAKAVLAGK